MADASERIIILSALLLFTILIGSPKIENQTEIQTEIPLVTTTSNIIFRYGVSGAKHPNELDTIRGYFQKDMVNKEPAWTKMDLTQNELDTIYQKMVEIDFFSYPKGFQPKLEDDVIGITTPFLVYNLEYQNETVSKVVYWNTQYIAPKDTQYTNLKELAQLIIELIQAKPEYQKLPKPTAGYA
jgi:hypothetical protein